MTGGLRARKGSCLGKSSPGGTCPPKPVGLGWDWMVVRGLSQVWAEVLVEAKQVTWELVWLGATPEDVDGHGSSPMSVASPCLAVSVLWVA